MDLVNNGRIILCPRDKTIIWESVLLPIGVESRYLTEFEEIDFIGHGDFGVVAKCKNKLDKQMYAVKKIAINDSDVLGEVKILAALKDSNIVRYYRSWIEPSFSGSIQGVETTAFHPCRNTDSPCLYILMEYCPRSLDSFLLDFKDSYSWEKAMTLFRQIVSAVAYMHQKRYVHLDLKVQNIFLDEDGNIKVGDFGIAENATGDYRGYEKHDIFDLGIILGQLLELSKESRFMYENLMEEREKHINDNPLDRVIEDQDDALILIHSLIMENEFKRPSAFEILRLLPNLSEPIIEEAGVSAIEDSAGFLSVLGEETGPEEEIALLGYKKLRKGHETWKKRKGLSLKKNLFLSSLAPKKKLPRRTKKLAWKKKR